jgi:acyl-CoA hydrolase
MHDIIQLQYEQKNITADEAAAMVKSGDKIFYGEFTMFPHALDEALAKRIKDLQDLQIGGVCFTSPPQVVLQDMQREHLMLMDLHFGLVSRKLHDLNLCNYIPNTYHQGPRIVKKYYDIDVGFFSVGAMDARGYFNLGPSNSITPALMEKTKLKIVEVNNTVPTCLGGNQESIHNADRLYRRGKQYAAEAAAPYCAYRDRRSHRQNTDQGNRRRSLPAVRDRGTSQCSWKFDR